MAGHFSCFPFQTKVKQMLKGHFSYFYFDRKNFPKTPTEPFSCRQRQKTLENDCFRRNLLFTVSSRDWHLNKKRKNKSWKKDKELEICSVSLLFCEMRISNTSFQEKLHQCFWDVLAISNLDKNIWTMKQNAKRRKNNFCSIWSTH